ncbi:MULTISPECIES: DsbA family protein [Pseudomonas]|uniref:DsbA family protein n=1 Tax=Pseudomonas TaxID=286 RepID=UPI0011BE1E68|nr:MULTISPECIES: DsbA family protein [Pseudomonas]MBA1246250.1 DsbA family protein [Pseudomonas zeshuii]QEU26952.1 DsbA family protein [Pseudomonas luteola]
MTNAHSFIHLSGTGPLPGVRIRGKGQAGVLGMPDQLYKQTGLDMDLSVLATRLSANLNAFRQGMTEHRYMEKLQQSVALARSISANGTPASFVTGH